MKFEKYNSNGWRIGWERGPLTGDKLWFCVHPLRSVASVHASQADAHAKAQEEVPAP